MHLILFYLIYLLAERHVRVFRPQGMSRMSSTRRAHVTTGVQGGRSGPPAPHPLLTSLAAQPASGDANILTSGECELLRRDAKVRADAGLLAWHWTDQRRRGTSAPCSDYSPSPAQSLAEAWVAPWACAPVASRRS